MPKSLGGNQTKSKANLLNFDNKSNVNDSKSNINYSEYSKRDAGQYKLKGSQNGENYNQMPDILKNANINSIEKQSAKILNNL